MTNPAPPGDPTKPTATTPTATTPSATTPIAATASGTTANGGSAQAKAGFELVVGKATDAYKDWQQVPAWVLGGAAIVGAGVLIVNPGGLSDAESRDAWAAIIVALFLAVLLSFRSAFTLNENGTDSGSGSSHAQGSDQQDEKSAPPGGK
jgi:uncharacterized membrane protein YraQ (UPF0718 family)